VEENKEVLNGTVLDEIKPGYLLGERLLRASVVKVSSGGPPQPKSEDMNKASAEERN
jgi:molecular chaperone GrpE